MTAPTGQPQCREGWHLEDEPAANPAPPDDWQTCLPEKRAELQRLTDLAQAAGDDTGELEELLAELDTELTKTGLRGQADPGRKDATRRHRSTRRRQDTPDLPRREVSPRTTGTPGGTHRQERLRISWSRGTSRLR